MAPTGSRQAEFAGRVALVLGGSGGIGLASAALLAERGAQVMISGRQADVPAAMEQLASCGEAVAALPAALDDEQAVNDLVAATVDRFGKLDIVIGAAGIQRYGTTTDTSTELWEEVFAINVRGAFFGVRAALPHLRASDAGSIVLVSSIQAFITQTGVAAYTASKGALNAFTRSLAIDEAKHNVRANVVCPGSVDTPMLRNSARSFSDGTDAGTQATIDSWGRGHPLGRVALPSEVAEAVCFLASTRSSFVTGVALPVDGGLLAQISVVLPD